MWVKAMLIIIIIITVIIIIIKLMQERKKVGNSERSTESDSLRPYRAPDEIPYYI